MTNIRTLALALAPFILIVLITLALPYVHRHVEEYEVQNIGQDMTVDGFSEELVTDSERGGPIGMRVRFTVHAPKPLPISRGAMFVSMGTAEGKEVTNNPHVVRLFPSGKPETNFGLGHNETGQPIIFFTSEANTSDT